ncbi:MAG: DUF3810 domain-containing protein [Oscillospiraceae bacterium]|nr:DUF3810 domain-containing protein [Oscillospiraceae bacterium]
MPTGKRKLRLGGYILAALLPSALITAFYVLAARTSVLVSVQRHFSRPALDAMGRAFSTVPFSFMEFYIVLVLAAVVLFLVRLIRRLILGPGPRLLTVLKYFLVLMCAAGVIWNGYCWLWNAGYYDSSFAEQAEMKAPGAYPEELESASRLFLSMANRLAPLVPRGEDGTMVFSLNDAMTEYPGLYDPLTEEFPCLSGQTTRPKGVFFSRIMSRMGFTGIFFPFSGETYINTHQPAWSIPDTVAHEIAHQRGVHLEAECNFLGIAACLQSGDARFQYSGYLCGLIHLTNALYKADPDAWADIRSGFCPELEADWQYNSRYWKEMEGAVSKVSDTVYDAFLKVNTQPSGLKSYGECVDLLILWMQESPHSPVKLTKRN